MKHLLLTTIAALVLVVGCGPSVDIYEAVSKGNIEAVKQHIAVGTDVDSALRGAVKYGQKEIAELLIANGADVNAKGRDGRTPLHDAAYKGHKEIAELLIANDADVNAKDNYTSTPLYAAAVLGRKEVAALLIAEGANVNAKRRSGGTPTPLDAAESVSQSYSPQLKAALKETADLLRKHGGKTSDWLKAAESIHIAAKAGHIEAVKKHLAEGADVNGRGGVFEGDTPLLHAVMNSRKEIVELLITNGADVNAKDADGFTPLDTAINSQHTEIADLLRKHGGKTGEELKAEDK
jgi:ankyrin repeat protein